MKFIASFLFVEESKPFSLADDVSYYDTFPEGCDEL